MPRASPVPAWVPDLPARPGVYHFEDRTGNVLYVGKSVNLKRRVRSYFYGSGPSDARLAEMLQIARGVSVVRTGTDLEARLEEAETILERRPPYNRAIKKRWRGWYLEIRWNEPFPRLGLVRSARRAGAQYFGPFWGRRVPEQIRRLTEKTFRLRTCRESLRPDPEGTACIQHELGLCTAPCIKRAGLNAYRRQVRAAARLLSDRSHGLTLRRRLESARDTASQKLEFERAAELQARLGWLEELEAYRFALESDGRAGSWLIVLPGAADEERVLQPVASGKVLRRRRVAWLPGRWEEAVEDACYAVRVGELQAHSVFPPEEVVPSMLVTRWLEEGAPDGRAFDLRRRDSNQVIEALRRDAAA